ncbi:uncharacterized protein [Typha latifolia]|uniref:uncharacterized protein n=1 Tax=Typha latifolia TaxID=4733 RepID=UPI003C2C562A
MYTARPPSSFKNSHGRHPLEGPISRLVLTDDGGEPDVVAKCCWGCCNVEAPLRDLPFPQDRMITIKYSPHRGERTRAAKASVFFVPVVDQLPMSNRYYVVVAKGRNKGKVYACSKDDTCACCSCGGVGQEEPRAFDHRNLYQQMEIVHEGDGFTAKSIAPDGQPPFLLGSKYWKAYASKHKNYHLQEALGLDAPIRACLPDLSFPISTRDAPRVAVGKWYSPFMFIKEECGLHDQMKHGMFYDITLEQYWKEVYACENAYLEEKLVEVNAIVDSKMALLDGKEVVVEDRKRHGYVWFKTLDGKRGMGLSLALWERMVWEQKRGGWLGDEEEVERIVRVEKYGGENATWKKFACYVLMERYVITRTDGSLAIAFDFSHVIKLRSKWE